MQAQIKEDIKVVADYLSIKAGQVNKIIALVEKERAKGDAIEAERGVIEAAESLTGE